MTSILTAAEPFETVADLVHRLGGIPLRRIRMQPPPGTATVEDVVAARDGIDKRLCELIDGVLVEKDMGAHESLLAVRVAQHINNYLDETDLGLAYGADGPFRILPFQVRLPDVSVFRWESLPGEEEPKDNVPELVPDIAIEVISEGNTVKEMERKKRDYFEAGVTQVWYIYPKKKSAVIYSAPDIKKRIASHQSLKGNDILPGFELPLAKLFERTVKRQKRK